MSKILGSMFMFNSNILKFQFQCGKICRKLITEFYFSTYNMSSALAFKLKDQILFLICRYLVAAIRKKVPNTI